MSVLLRVISLLTLVLFCGIVWCPRLTYLRVCWFMCLGVIKFPSLCVCVLVMKLYHLILWSQPESLISLKDFLCIKSGQLHVPIHACSWLMCWNTPVVSYSRKPVRIWGEMNWNSSKSLNSSKKMVNKHIFIFSHIQGKWMNLTLKTIKIYSIIQGKQYNQKINKMSVK